ncbi:MAG TPA: gas vesicle protein K [Vicinamibacterales bacterium]|nr:gas vesicle protein K [Vicinamibacterales bacterium]
MKTKKNRTRTSGRRTRTRARGHSTAPAVVSAAELRALRSEIEARLRRPKASGAPMRWNPDPEDVQKSVAQLVLTIVEFLRQLMERQAVRRMEQKTLTKKEIEAVGVALMTLETTVRDIGKRFGLSPEDLNLDLGPLGKLI